MFELSSVYPTKVWGLVLGKTRISRTLRTETPHRPVVEPLVKPDNPEYKDVIHCKAAL